MTAAYNRAEVDRLMAEARGDGGAMLAAFREFGDSYLIRTKHGAYGTHAIVLALERLLAMADQLEAARTRIAELEATNWTVRQQLEGLQANLTDARREASALRDRRGLPSDG